MRLADHPNPGVAESPASPHSWQAKTDEERLRIFTDLAKQHSSDEGLELALSLYPGFDGAFTGTRSMGSGIFTFWPGKDFSVFFDVRF